MPGKLIRLQGIGWVDAVPASELVAGDRVMFNYGSVYTVEAITRETKHTTWYDMADVNGKIWPTSYRKTKLMAKLRSI